MTKNKEMNYINRIYNNHSINEAGSVFAQSFDQKLITPKALLYLAFLILLTTSCEKFLAVDVPKSLVTNETVFNNDEIAIAAVRGIYANMMAQPSFASGYDKSVATLTGLSADELDNYYNSVNYIVFEENRLLPDNNYVLNMWESIYKSIYDANLIIEGLSNSSGVTKDINDQLMGEALFIRAFCHFYLVNLFGDVPLIISTDYRENAVAQKTSKTNAYKQIVDDLIKAKLLLPNAYVEPGRVRPNRGAATAMLARVFLFTEDWDSAELNSTEIIENSGQYRLLTDLNEVFVANSEESIWQLSLPTDFPVSTFEGYYFRIQFASDLNNNILRPGFINAFENNDQRLISWVKSYAVDTGLVFFSDKYKFKFNNGTSPENSMVLRFAEQYLIRAEARVRNGDLPGAISDLDSVRNRAGLPLIVVSNPTISGDDLLLLIERERRVELFLEWGHRWFDLKRYNHANAVLGAIKPSWIETDTLYPIPQSEMNKNPKLFPQNIGY